CAQGTALPWAF
nr:immunoglobulin light chain junction region [Macaca mulatta]MOX97188.1 immunoglobulin light chain junction region [Macaca mulatta]MOX97204.1 immunoglobulin light chain junction region [Macaca mulatta]MOX97243.1 immunoglobulin light chain junction region [Macaca mulatta]MOX97709.1 immunoglobulin light chain junction region [Macaca mulatta]